MTTDTHSTAGVEQASTAELLSRVTTQVSTLVRDELALARVELTTKAKRAGTGVAMFSAAGLLAVYGVGLAVVVVALALVLVWPAWLATLVTAVGVLALAGLVALLGRAQIRRAAPPMPTEAAESVAADLDVVKTAIHHGRQA